MKALTYKNGLAICDKDGEKFESNSKPYLSFEYDELHFNDHNKYLIKNLEEVSLNQNQIEEVIAFIDNVSIDDNVELLQKLMNFLNKTDWMVIRELETGKKMPTHIKIERSEYRKRISELKRIIK